MFDGNYISGRWYSMAPLGAQQASGAAGKNTIQLGLIRTERDIAVSDLGCYVTTAQAGQLVQLAVYAADDTTGDPTGVPLAETGSMSVAAVGPQAAIAALVSTAAMTSAMIGSDTLADVDNGGLKFTTPSNIGTWPDLTSVSCTKFSGANGPNVLMKAA